MDIDRSTLKVVLNFQNFERNTLKNLSKKGVLGELVKFQSNVNVVSWVLHGFRVGLKYDIILLGYTQDVKISTTLKALI